ncbi:MAG: PKD domain-containing protein, partial [Bacteroidetes bacterium]
MNRLLSSLRAVLCVLLLSAGLLEANAQCANITPSFSVNATGCGIPRNYTFTNTSTGVSNGVATYIWRHGSTVLDTFTGTASTPTLNITNPGTDTVWLVAIDTNGCRDSVMNTLVTTTTANTIYDQSTNTFNYSPVWQNCILFLSSPDSFVIDVLASGTLTNYYMIWGDGGIDSGNSLPNGNTISHSYQSLGTYTVRIVSQNGSCIDTVTGTVINERIPTAGIIGPPAGGNVGCAPHTVRFINNSSNVSNATEFRWDMGDGNTYLLGSGTANDTLFHTYTEGLCNGLVSVTAFNACGSSTATWTPIFVNDEDDASFTVNTTNCDPNLPFTFTNTSTNNYCTPSQRLFYWDFGDGSTVGWINNTLPQNHTFPQAGSYRVRLIDSNLCGTDTFEFQAIINFTPVPGFLYSVDNGCPPLEVTVIDTTAGVQNLRNWTYGNGQVSADSIDTVTYVTPGTYNLQLTVSNICGTVSTSVPINVWSPPDALLASINDGCSPHQVGFTNGSTFFHDSTVSFFWDFGDGTTSTDRDPPNKIYTNPGTYQVRLYVIDTCGTDSVIRTFTVHPKPEAGFSSDTVCQGVANSFSDTSTVSSGSITGWTWRFDNPSQGSSSQQNPNFTFNAADTFPVRLIVSTNHGCLDTAENPAVVWANPITSWAVAPNDSVCIGTAQTFDGTAAAGSGTIASYFWDFANGTTSAQEDTALTYPTAGNYSVKFRVINTLGCADSSIGTITVLPLPQVQFTADTACVGQLTTFTDLSTVSLGTIALREWDLDNNGSFDSTGINTSYIYNSIGSRYVRLRVSTAFGCQNLDSNLISVNPQPVPAISVDSSTICMGQPVTVSNTSTGAVSFTYDFGDGTQITVGNTSSVQHTYTDSGIYTIRMYATSDRGCIDSTTATVTVRPTPLAQFTVNQQIACAPFNFVFTNGSLRSSVYEWYSDGHFASAAEHRPDTLISLDSQVVRITLIANNTFSCPADTAELTIGTSRNPIASFVTNPDSGCGPLNVAFGNTSQFASSFTWDFGNGQNSSASDTSMSFTAAAVNDSTYTIRLIAFNWQGCPDTTEASIVVHPNPTVSFTQSNTDSCGPLTVSFTNTSVHNAGGNQGDMSFVWDFGNGITTTALDTVVDYIASQTIDSIYTVRLIGQSRYGCLDTFTSTVTVYPNPVAQFTVSQADSCGPFGVQFNNLSIPNNGGAIGIMSFEWNLGNGQTSNAQNPFTTYPASLIQDSVFAIQLIARSEHGCPDTAVSSVRSYPKPNAFYTQSDTSGCGPLDITFTNLSVPYDTGTINNMTFAWDFGNGTTSTAQDTTVRFISAPANDTVYTVRMIAFSEHGCADTFTSTVRVHPGPVAQFTVNQAIACAPFNFVFTNTSFNSNNFYWMVDGVVTSNQTTRPDTLISLDSSTALIGLIAETSFGCPNDTTEMLIGTSRNPIASFVTNPDSGCGPLSVAFGNTSQFASSFTWNFGNGQNSSASDTSMTFTAAAVNDSTYTIQLIAYNWQGCPDTTEAPIVVHPNPAVSFTQSNTDSCGPLTVSFTNTSVHNAGGNQGDMSFTWDFGNGATSTAADTSVAYFASQLNDTSYTVRLIGQSRYGCPDTAFSTVAVYPNPVAQFTVSQADSCGPFSVQFTNQSVPNNGGAIGIMTFDWDLGNGQTSTTQNPFSSYPASLIQDSLYTIRLIAYSEHGCPDTAENTVRAYPKPTAAYNQSDTSGCGPLSVDFTNTSLPYDTSSLADMTFEWDFGNGQTSTTANNTIVYTAAALTDTVYTVRLIAYSEHGCADTTFSTVRVHPKPSVSLTKDDSTGCDPVPVNFTASGVNVAIYHWDFRDGTTTTVQNPSHDFRAVPFYDTTYRVSLVGESAFGCPSDTIFTDVTVLGNPFADFTVLPDSVCASTTSQMINNSLGAVTYFWDFGNGDTSSAVSPQAHYTLNPSADTSYHIQLIATNTFGCRDTAEGYVVVSPSPTAQFILDIDSGCSPLQVQFTDQSQFAFRHNWLFSNGFSDTAQNPTAIFTNSSISDSLFTATLIVTNAGGCQDTAVRQIRIYPFPTADFVASPAAGCGDLSITFNNQSTPNDTGSIADMSFAWDLGNGLTSSATSPTSIYPRSSFQDSLYQVTLIGVSEHGCRDTVSKSVRTYPRPVASFTQSDTSGCGPLVVSFNNTSIPNDTGNIGIMNFVWNFGNGLISYDQNDTVTFYPAQSQDTVYTIRLIALSEHGCRDTTYSTVRVHPNPTVAFTQNPSSGCGPLSVAFTSATLNASSYFWDFGNGDTSTAQHPNAIFQNRPDFDTTYSVSFSALSPFGCPSDTVSRNVTVRPDPVAAFTQNLDSVCGTSTITFANSSTGANSYAWSFGDGSTSSQANPQHSFAMNPTNDTTYTVRLIANNFFGCSDTVFGSVTIYPFPTAVITTSVDNGCTPLAVNFGHSSLLSTTYSWSFGNGNTSTSETPNSSFSNATLYDTIYNVQLMVESVHGCADSVIAPIRVYPLPTASFATLPSTGCGDLAVNFSNQSTPNDTGSINIMSFNWDLGNGQTSTAQNPSANYVRSLIQDSVYTIELIATSEHGCLDTTTRDVRVFPKPDAVFTQSDTSGCGPLTVQFTNVSVPFDTGSIADMSFMWDFGNGQSAVAQNPSM